MLYRLYQLNTTSFNDLLKKDGYSDTYIKNNQWKYYYLLTKLLYKTRISKDTTKFVKMSMQGLDTVLGNSKIKGVRKRFSTQIVDDFLKWNLIKRSYTNSTATGQHITTIKIKLLDEVTALGWCVWSPNKVVTLHTKPQQHTGVYAQIQQYLPSITIDADAARLFAYEAYINQMPIRSKKKGHKLVLDRFVDVQIYSHWLTVIDEIESGNYNLKVDHLKTGRVFTVISNMPRELRQFIRINGKPLVELDIANCQPLVFCIHLLKAYGADVPADVAEYIRLCSTGTFYKEVMKLVVAEGEVVSADTFKPEFFGKVFFSTENKAYKWRKRFADAFPNVSEAISQVKVNNYKELSIMLSNQESEIIIKNITARLYREGVTEFTSIHDSLLCTADCVDECYNVILEEFKKYGLSAHIKA